MDKELLYKYFRGETSAEEELEIITWVEASALNRQEYLNERKIWNALLLQSVFEQEQKRSINLFSVSHIVRYAAAILIIVTIGLYSLNKSLFEKQITLADVSEPTLILDEKKNINLSDESFSMKDKLNNTISNNHAENQLSYRNTKETKTKAVVTMHRLLVPHGKTYQLILPDSTEVILNAETEFQYPSSFEGATREVKLLGEAFFKVKRNACKPFIVHTSQLDVRVLGTIFNVSSYPMEDQLKATLVNGSIQVEQNGEKLLISPSEQFLYDKKNHFWKKRIVDTDLFTSWTKNEFIFKNTTLEDIFHQLGHWYKFSVQYENELLKEKKFSFRMDRKTSLDHFIKIINNTQEVILERTNNNIYIKQRMNMNSE